MAHFPCFASDPQQSGKELTCHHMPAQATKLIWGLLFPDWNLCRFHHCHRLQYPYDNCQCENLTKEERGRLTVRSVRKESKVSSPLACLTHCPCTNASARGKPHLQLPRLAKPAANNGRTAGSHTWRLHNCSRLAPVCVCFQCKEFIKEEHSQLMSTFLRRKKGDFRKKRKAFFLTSSTPLREPPHWPAPLTGRRK